jgi:hypothetical protein
MRRVELRDSSGALVPATITYDVQSRSGDHRSDCRSLVLDDLHRQLQGEARRIHESRIYRGTRSPHVHAVVHDQATTAAADRWSWRSNPRRELDQQSVQPRRREILRAEGMNEFAAVDLSTVTATTLNPYDVVILGEVPLTQCTATIKAGVKDLRVTRCRPTSYGVW